MRGAVARSGMRMAKLIHAGPAGPVLAALASLCGYPSAMLAKPVPPGECVHIEHAQTKRKNRPRRQPGTVLNRTAHTASV
nr:MAG TPA: hypothetical protein [Bacteriophage sp.]